MQILGHKLDQSYLLIVGLFLVSAGILGLIHSSYPQGNWKGTNPGGGPGAFLEIEASKGIQISETGIVRVSYGVYPAPEIDSSGQMTVPNYSDDITVTLKTASFQAEPQSGRPIGKQIQGGTQYQWLWIIYPKQLGKQHIALEFEGMYGTLLGDVASELGVDQLTANSLIMETHRWPIEEVRERADDPNYSYDLVIPIEVVNLFGLTAMQAKLASVLTAFVGSGFTVTWIYEQWQKLHREDKKSEDQAHTSIVGGEKQNPEDTPGE